MSKRKTDNQLQDEISRHSKTMREFLEKSRQIHKNAMALGFDEIKRQEHFQTMNRAIEFQRLAIAESKKVIRLEKILLNRQTKRMNGQKADLD